MYIHTNCAGNISKAFRCWCVGWSALQVSSNCCCWKTERWVNRRRTSLIFQRSQRAEDNEGWFSVGRKQQHFGQHTKVNSWPTNDVASSSNAASHHIAITSLNSNRRKQGNTITQILSSTFFRERVNIIIMISKGFPTPFCALRI